MQGTAAACRIDATRIYLRDVQEQDATERYVAWMNDAAVTRYMETRFATHTVESLREYVSMMRHKAGTLFLAIVVREGDRHIGNIKLGPIDQVHGLADVALMIGDRQAWGKGYATEAIAALSEHAFRTLGVRKLTAGCYAANVGSRRAFEKAGYHVEATRPAHYFCDGVYEDAVLMALFNGDYRR